MLFLQSLFWKIKCLRDIFQLFHFFLFGQIFGHKFIGLNVACHIWCCCRYFVFCFHVVIFILRREATFWNVSNILFIQDFEFKNIVTSFHNINMTIGFLKVFRSICFCHDKWIHSLTTVNWGNFFFTICTRCFNFS